MKTSRPLLVDTHAHLDLLIDAEQEVRKARSLGVLAVIGVSMGGDSISATMRLKERLPEIVLPALGLHPWQIDREAVEKVLGAVEDHVSPNCPEVRGQ